MDTRPGSDLLGQDRLGSPSCTTLLSLRDWRGAALCASVDGSLLFQAPGQDGQCYQGSGAGVWLLAAAGGAPTSGGSSYSLQHAASRRFLAAAGGRMVLSDAPQQLQLFMDMERSVVLSFPGKACLQSGAGGAALAGTLPLGRDRTTKLFRLQEVGLPPHSLRPWPLRCVLRCDPAAGGAYLSACGQRALAAAALAACCSEEFLLALGQGSPLASQSSTLVAAGSSVWTGDGERLLSAEPLTAQVLLAPQHGCSGGESFTLHLSRTGELSMLAEPAHQQRPAGTAAAGPAGSEDSCSGAASLSGSGSGSSGGSELESGAASGQPVPVVVQQGGRLALHSRGKPCKFGLELASHRPTLLLTAHGHLVGSRSRGSGRPCGILPAAAHAAEDDRCNGSSFAGASFVSHGNSCGSKGPSAAAARACAWRLEHHGDGVYSLQTDGDRRSLYIDDAGVPCLDAPAGQAGMGGSLVFPDPRLLFWIEPAWVEVGGEQGASGSGASSKGRRSSSSSSSGCSAASAAGSSGGSGGSGDLSSSCSSTQHPSGFVLPGPAGLMAAGFALRSVCCVRGRHLYLSALPDGLLTTVLATGPPSRWEIFSVVDLQTLLGSPLGLLRHLPCAAAAVPPPHLRRTTSMHALPSSSTTSSLCNSGSCAVGDSGILPRPPSLPAVQEHQPEPALPASGHGLGHHCGSAPHLASAAAAERQQQLGGSLPPRRSQSDSALCMLPRQAKPQRWLAELSRQPRQPSGWGLRSAATLQDLACRALCADLVQRWQEQHGGRWQLHASLVRAVEKELSSLLPEEIAARIGRELRLLACPPPATKLSLQQLASKAASMAGGVAGSGSEQGIAADGLPDWVAQLVEREQGAALGQWQPTEAHLCCACRGSSGVLLPMCPYANPRHHLFLAAMERRARGGGRVRLRARRRLDQDDPLTALLRAGKAVLLGWFAARTLGALLA